jgi:Asp-tRNA(Asn)/Glu-tRNA(Gln) amidotransferase B subunit
MSMEHRNVVDRTDEDFEHGHREVRRDADSPWSIVPRSDFVRAVGTFWFQRAPHEIMLIDMGFATTRERAAEFEGASASDPAMWYYLGMASRDHGFMGEPTDEPLKWIMSALAAEAKIRGLRFTDIPGILPAHYLSWFAYGIREGVIERSFAKAVFAELLLMRHLPLHDERAGLEFNALITKPEFRPLATDDLGRVLDDIIEANGDQFDKARENPKLVQWFVGQAMKATGGKASAPKIIEIMTARLAA